ncbi:MAG TPA: translesion error-prone DNA polymerase V autoproteolytic subunit [Methylophilus sp.]
MTQAQDNNRGGKRLGAGRKPWSPFKEHTVAMRIPVSQAPNVRDFLEALKRKKQQESLANVAGFVQPALALSTLALPLFASKVPAGIPSAVDDHVETRLDPNEFLIDQKDSTFFVTIQGESMLDVGLLPGDKAVVDRAKLPMVGDIVLAMVDGEFTIKTLARKKDGAPKLLPANSSGKYQSIEITGEMQFEVWGVVTGSFRRFR